ncbi:hypothetical protein B5G16_05200 [Alistipes sp. An66]|nr:hypothetical protein B5G16_05200 [Alistipes sp. An66]
MCTNYEVYILQFFAFKSNISVCHIINNLIFIKIIEFPCLILFVKRNFRVFIYMRVKIKQTSPYIR